MTALDDRTAMADIDTGRLDEVFELMPVPEGFRAEIVGEYVRALEVGFGGDIDLTGTTVDLVLRTADFPRD
ncbi:hypothetical protein ACIQ7S_21915 [Streptomyces griseoluteus]|uniref:hypothetical protein n=1 Tax=Streptomyces griseoluteus TaxID=29306 RepID=UPI00381D2066